MGKGELLEDLGRVKDEPNESRRHVVAIVSNLRLD